MVEERIKEIALNYAEQGRPDRDVLHVPAVVFYMKKLIAAEGGDERVLVPAAWLHDIGYAGLLEEGYSNEDNEAVKDTHMEAGARMARKDLSEIDTFSAEEIDEICRLISIHDNLEAIQDFNAQMLFEADSLGQIDVDKVPPNFSKEEVESWLETDFKARRVPRFKTETGKELLDALLKEIESHYN